MSFINSGSVPHQFTNLGSSLASISRGTIQQNLPLNSPMIDRVHKAKPGCSACGKKVA